MEDQQASTVKGEEESMAEAEMKEPVTDSVDKEVDTPADELTDEESPASDEVVEEPALEPMADEEPEAEMEATEIESEAAEEASVESETETEEADAETGEPDADAEEPVADAEDSASEVPTDIPPAEASPNGNDGQAAALAVELATEAEVQAPGRKVAEPDDGREWYVVHCYSGYENKVRHNLEQRIETMDMKGKIFDVVVPTEEEMEVKDGKRRTVERRVFPAYILVQMIMDEDSWYVVRNTPGVTGFVGMGNEPTPLRPEEVSQIVKRMEADAPRIKVTYDVGQKVRIIDGPFNDFIGTVDDIDMEKAKVRVMVSFFGRETPVELDFLQVEKA